MSLWHALQTREYICSSAVQIEADVLHPRKGIVVFLPFIITWMRVYGAVSSVKVQALRSEHVRRDSVRFPCSACGAFTHRPASLIR